MLIDQLVVVVDSTRPAVFGDTLAPKLTKLSGIPRSHDHVTFENPRYDAACGYCTPGWDLVYFMAHRKEVQLFKLLHRDVAF